MADHKKVIMQFKKTASSEERAKLMDDLKAKGAQVTNDDNINSRVMPFVSLALPEDHFDALRSESLGGDHKVVENVEEDTEMRIQ